MTGPATPAATLPPPFPLAPDIPDESLPVRVDRLAHRVNPPAPPPIPFQQRYRQRLSITKELCGCSSHVTAWEKGTDITVNRNWCRRWDEEHCARRMGKAEVDKAKRVPISVVLWRDADTPEETDRIWARVRQWLRRHGVESLPVRLNDAVWWFLKGSIDRVLLDRGARRYGFIIRALDPDPNETEAYLTWAFGVEDKPLNGRRKFRPSAGFYRGDGDEGGGGGSSAWNDAEDSSPEETGIESSASLQEAGEAQEHPDPRGKCYQFHVAAGTAAKRRRELEADDRYWVHGTGDEDCWRAVWRGQGPRPSWNFPNVIISGF